MWFTCTGTLHGPICVSVRVGPDGQKIDDGNERYRSKAITRSIEKEYGLRRATKRQEREGTVPLRKEEYRRSGLKAQIASVVRNVTDRYKFCSLKEYNSILHLFRVEAEEVRGEIGGRDALQRVGRERRQSRSTNQIERDRTRYGNRVYRKTLCEKRRMAQKKYG